MPEPSPSSAPRTRIACLGDDSVAGQGLCAMLRTSERYEVVDADGLGADLTVVLLTEDADGQLSRIVDLAAAGSVVAVGPVDLTADALKAGAIGYATGSARTDDFLGVIDSTLKGRRALSQEATEFLIGNTGDRPLRAENLTGRQAEILRLLVSGEPIGAIASRLGVSRQAVGQTLERLRRRARVESNRALVKFVRDHRLIQGL